MRLMLLLALPFLAAWDNPLEGTIYDRDVEGIPRAAWIDMGRIMNCVLLNEGTGLIPVTSYEMQDVRNQLYRIESLLRQGRIGDGTGRIDGAELAIRRATKVDCPNIEPLR